MVQKVAPPAEIQTALKAKKPLNDDQRRALRSVDAVNGVRKIVPKLASADVTIGWLRFTVLAVFGLIMVLSTAGVLWSITRSTVDIPSVIATSGVAVASLLVAGWTNPLQTIERDMVFRRWSDTIVSSYLTELSSPHAHSEDIDLAASAAARRFTKLAISYSSLASKTTDAMVELAKQSVAESEEAHSATPTQISVDNPGSQKSPANKLLSPVLVISAKGPGKLTYVASSLPSGLAIDPATGTISGTTSAKADPIDVTVTVTSDADDTGSASVVFTWAVTD